MTATKLTVALQLWLEGIAWNNSLTLGWEIQQCLVLCDTYGHCGTWSASAGYLPSTGIKVITFQFHLKSMKVSADSIVWLLAVSANTASSELLYRNVYDQHFDHCWYCRGTRERKKLRYTEREQQTNPNFQSFNGLEHWEKETWRGGGGQEKENSTIIILKKSRVLLSEHWLSVVSCILDFPP